MERRSRLGGRPAICRQSSSFIASCSLQTSREQISLLMMYMRRKLVKQDWCTHCLTGRWTEYSLVQANFSSRHSAVAFLSPAVSCVGYGPLGRFSEFKNPLPAGVTLQLNSITSHPAWLGTGCPHGHHTADISLPFRVLCSGHPFLGLLVLGSCLLGVKSLGFLAQIRSRSGLG